MTSYNIITPPCPGINCSSEVDLNIKKIQMKLSPSGLVLYIPHYKFIFRKLRKFIKNSYSTIKFMIAPFTPQFATLTVLTLSVNFSLFIPPGSIKYPISAIMPKFLIALIRTEYVQTLLSCILCNIPQSITDTLDVFTAVVLYTTVAIFIAAAYLRFITRHLLLYTGWVNDSHKNPSLKTKVWGLILKYLLIRSGYGGTFGYENCLPSLPIPPLKQTIDKYVHSLKGFASEEEQCESIQDATAFLNNEGPKLQRYLHLKWLTSSNYVTDWWENYAYLYNREPLIINSNWYGVCPSKLRITKDVAARAAEAAYIMAKLQRDIAERKLKPLIFRDMIPLCMHQYKSAFATVRIPGVEHDSLVTYEHTESRYIIVLCDGALYKVQLYSTHSNNLLTPHQLYGAFRGILDAYEGKSVPISPYQKQEIAALTTMNRTEWAIARKKHFLENSYNAKQLEVIEKAAFCVTLIDEAPINLSEEGKLYLAGNGSSHWADKSINVIIDRTTQVAINVEHTWGEALIGAHLLEYIADSIAKQHNFHPDGTLKLHRSDIQKEKVNHLKAYPAEQIVFQMNTDLIALIKKAKEDHMKCVDNLDYEVFGWHGYGKSIAKRSQCSPDAWVQMALQLAIYRDQNRFVQTYESSMTRLFKYGRTETIRSASDESRKFVLSMMDTNIGQNEKLALLKRACASHQKQSMQTMVGQGVDRHLFALYIVSVGKGIPSQFLKGIFARKWTLSTSQTPNNQEGFWTEPCKDEMLSPNGGFGTVDSNGYGVSYVMYLNHIFFNISSKFECNKTSSAKFAEELRQALTDMEQLI